MRKSNRYCAPVLASSAGNTNENTDSRTCSAREEKSIEVDSSGGGAMLPYVRLHKLIQE